MLMCSSHMQHPSTTYHMHTRLASAHMDLCIRAYRPYCLARTCSHAPVKLRAPKHRHIRVSGMHIRVYGLKGCQTTRSKAPTSYVLSSCNSFACQLCNNQQQQVIGEPLAVLRSLILGQQVCVLCRASMHCHIHVCVCVCVCMYVCVCVCVCVSYNTASNRTRDRVRRTEAE